MPDLNVKLTPAQQLAVLKLKQALTECSKAGVYLWDDYGRISAINGRHIQRISTSADAGESLERSDITVVQTKCWHGSNADDPLYLVAR